MNIRHPDQSPRHGVIRSSKRPDVVKVRILGFCPILVAVRVLKSEVGMTFIRRPSAAPEDPF
jgi:hypothetical protein